MLLAEPEKYRDTINEIKKDIAHMPIELKKTWGRKYCLMYETEMTFVMVVNFKKLPFS